MMTHSDDTFNLNSIDDFEISALPQNAGLARDRVKTVAMRAGVSADILDEVIVAFGEAVTNAILYGSSGPKASVRVRCYLEPDGKMFTVEVSDRGRGFDPDHVRQAQSDDALGGRGLRLMRALTDRLLLYYDNGGMNVRLSKSISRE